MSSRIGSFRPSRNHHGTSALVRVSCIALVALATFGPVASADMLIAGGSSYYNQSDRFYSGTNPPKAFAFSQFNFSAVGNTNGAAGNGFWGTLISADYILEANHFHAPEGSTFSFETTNSTTGPVLKFTAGPGMEVGTTDLYVAKLTTSTVNSGLVPYAIASDNENALTNAKIYGVGDPWRVGTNNIDGFATAGLDFTSPSPGETGRTFLYDYNNSNPTGNPFENMLQTGDSGGPSFVAYGNRLALVGIHWFNFQPGDASYTPYGGSGDSFVPADIAAINQTILALGGTPSDFVTVVPEPSTLALTALGLLGLVARAVRGRRATSR